MSPADLPELHPGISHDMLPSRWTSNGFSQFTTDMALTREGLLLRRARISSNPWTLGRQPNIVTL